MSKVLSEYRVFDFTIKEKLIEAIIDYISMGVLDRQEKKVWVLLQSMVS